MSPFRLRGRNRDSAAPDWPSTEPDHEEPDWAAGFPATRAARPLAVPTDDPPTDPYGWPPVPDPATPAVAGSTAFDPAWPMPEPDAVALPTASDGARSAAPLPRAPGGGPPGPGRPAARPGATGPGQPTPDPAEAAGLAAAFAVDYLSWDQDDVARRGQVLAGYLREPGPDPAYLGWSGAGRQRAELAVPGRICADPQGRLLVDVRVRVTPYEAVGDVRSRARPGAAAGSADAAPEPRAGTGSVPAVAPAPAGRGWRSLPSRWVRLWVPVLCDRHRLMIDSWESPVPPAAQPPAAPPPRGEALPMDDPFVDPPAGGAA
ncbi:MAG TPA: hypothetical protein VNO83_18255 [Pseudonocardia sp.]|nr:hypothetical protein [Pseudonocardia sp.]